MKRVLYVIFFLWEWFNENDNQQYFDVNLQILPCDKFVPDDDKGGHTETRRDIEPFFPFRYLFVVEDRTHLDEMEKMESFLMMFVSYYFSICRANVSLYGIQYNNETV